MNGGISSFWIRPSLFMDAPHVTRRGASEKKKGWTISLTIMGDDPNDNLVGYLVEGAATASRTCPRTKPAASGPDEEQDTRGQPGWWFLLSSRHFRPLPVTPAKQTFPSYGIARPFLLEAVKSNHSFPNEFAIFR
jgi:hypothetical protein